MVFATKTLQHASATPCSRELIARSRAAREIAMEMVIASTVPAGAIPNGVARTAPNRSAPTAARDMATVQFQQQQIPTVGANSVFVSKPTPGLTVPCLPVVSRALWKGSVDRAPTPTSRPKRSRTCTRLHAATTTVCAWVKSAIVTRDGPGTHVISLFVPRIATKTADASDLLQPPSIHLARLSVLASRAGMELIAPSQPVTTLAVETEFALMVRVPVSRGTPDHLARAKTTQSAVGARIAALSIAWDSARAHAMLRATVSARNAMWVAPSNVSITAGSGTTSFQSMLVPAILPSAS